MATMKYKTIHLNDFLCKNLCNSWPSKAVNFLPFPTPNLEESCATLDCSHLLLHLLYLGFHPPNVKFEDRSGRTACFAPGKKRRKKKIIHVFPLGIHSTCDFSTFVFIHKLTLTSNFRFLFILFARSPQINISIEQQLASRPSPLLLQY